MTDVLKSGKALPVFQITNQAVNGEQSAEKCACNIALSPAKVSVPAATHNPVKVYNPRQYWTMLTAVIYVIAVIAVITVA